MRKKISSEMEMADSLEYVINYSVLDGGGSITNNTTPLFLLQSELRVKTQVGPVFFQERVRGALYKRRQFPVAFPVCNLNIFSRDCT